MAGAPMPGVRHETTNQIPADWSSESSGVYQVDEMVPGVSLTASRAERTYLIQDIRKVGYIIGCSMWVCVGVLSCGLVQGAILSLHDTVLSHIDVT